jgi:hypothetical protein
MQDGCDHQHGQAAETHECRLADYLGSTETPKADAPTQQTQSPSRMKTKLILTLHRRDSLTVQEVQGHAYSARDGPRRRWQCRDV